MTTLLTVAGLLLFPLIALAIGVRAIMRPDRDDFLDDEKDWGAQ